MAGPDAPGGCACAAAGAAGGVPSLWWTAVVLTGIALRLATTRRPRM